MKTRMSTFARLSSSPHPAITAARTYFYRFRSRRAPPAARPEPRSGRCLAALAPPAGAVRLAELICSGGWGADPLLSAARLNGNRIAPNTALCLLLAGAALSLIDVKGRRGRG